MGAGGHARVLIDALRALDATDIVGVVDRDPTLAGRLVAGVPVLGTDDELAALYARGVRHAFLGVGAVRGGDARARCYERLRTIGFEVLTIVHPAAYVSASARLGTGVTILSRAVVQTGAVVEENALVNTAAVVEHDCRVGPHVHIASGAILAGGVRVGARAHVGAGAVVRELTEIGEGATVGMGAVVVAPVAAGSVVVGNPARALRRAPPAESRGHE